MIFDKEEQNDMFARQYEGNREGYKPEEQTNGEQQRSRIQRPRIQSHRQRVERISNDNDERGFRPEGFGGGFETGNPSQSGSYRPNRNYRQEGQRNEGGYRKRPYQNPYGNEECRGGYKPYSQGGYYKQSYRQDEGGNARQPYPSYKPRYNTQDRNSGYNENRYNRYDNRGHNEEFAGSYENRHPEGRFPYRQDNYRSTGGRSGSSVNRSGYKRPYTSMNQEDGNGTRDGYAPREYRADKQRGGYQKNKSQRSRTYDPNAKYSLKKRIEYSEEHIDPNEPIRLNKFLANAGLCSRREADELIIAGAIKVNGVVVTELGTKVMRTDEIVFNEHRVTLEKKVYVLLNKPKDCVTTSDDPQQRKTVMDLVKDACIERIYPVGRLDRNTTGVLLLTNDGELASKLTHPKFLKKKVYHVYLDKKVTAYDLQQIRDGIQLEDGEIHADAIEYASDVDKAQVGIEIHSGKNRIVRRIFESLGYRVMRLDRVQFAGLTKKNVRRGDWRFLTEKEVEMLRMGAFE